MDTEVAAQKKINEKMEASIKRIFEKYPEVPTDPEDFNRFLTDFYLAGATDAVELLKGENE